MASEQEPMVRREALAEVRQVDELLATKLRGSGLEEHIEVIARIDSDDEEPRFPVFKL